MDFLAASKKWYYLHRGDLLTLTLEIDGQPIITIDINITEEKEFDCVQIYYLTPEDCAAFEYSSSYYTEFYLNGKLV